MFSDPIVVVLSTVSHNLARVQDDGLKSVYNNPDRTLIGTISHQPAKGRVRRMLRLDQTKVAADPLTSVNKSVTCGVYFVLDVPDFGFSVANVQDLLDALTSLMVDATTAKMLADEH
jgi:hypothetical protein